MTKQKIIKGLLIALLVPACAIAQSFKRQAALSAVEKDGFYAIRITPEITKYTTADFRDLRLADAVGKFVPYILKVTGNLSPSPAPQQPLTIISQETKDSTTTIILKNTGKALTNLSLEIKNAIAARTGSISGSNDLQHWYSITDHFSLGEKYNVSGTAYTENMMIPSTDYAYLKITLNNGKYAPLNILSASSLIYYSDIVAGEYQAVPTPQYTTKDSAGSSYYFFNDSNAYLINRVIIHVKGPRFFSRAATVNTKDQSTVFTHLTDSIIELPTPSFKEKKWWIEISNGDNPPLQISSIATSQRVHVLIAYLEKDKLYHLEMDDANATAPVYDLAQFADSIPANLPALSIAGIAANPITETVQPKTSIWNKAWLWVILGLILLSLSAFTVKLVKEVNEGKK